MSNYKPHPSKKVTPSRLARKQERSKVYEYNRSLRSLINKEKKVARRAARERAQEKLEAAGE